MNLFAKLLPSHIGTAATDMGDYLPYPIWRRDKNLNLLWVNDAYATAIGSSQQDILTRQIELFAGGRDPTGRNLATAAQNTHSLQIAEQHTVINGARRLMEVTEKPLPDGTLLGHAVDRTVLEELQDELQRARNTQIDVLQKLATAIIIFNNDGTVRFFNEAYLGLTGLDEEWLKTNPKFSQVLEELRGKRKLPEQADFRSFKQGWQNWFTELLSPHEELLHLPDGKTLRMRVVPHPAGGLLFTFEDITDRLVLESSFNTLIAVQGETLDNMKEAVALIGGDGRLKLWNPAFAEMWQVSTDVLQTAPHVNDLAVIYQRHFTAGAWLQLSGVLLDAVLDRQDTEQRLMLEDSRTIDFASIALPDGATLTRFMDVTDSTRVAAALQEKAAALTAADFLKSEFLMNVSYQLRTPLSAIMGFTELLKLLDVEQLTQRQQDYIQNIFDASHSLLALIDNLLELSSIQAGYVSLEKKSFDVHELLKDMQLFGETMSVQHGLRFRCDFTSQVGMLNADAKRLKQIILGLLSNAMRHSPAGGLVTMRAVKVEKDAKPGIEFQVFDQGAGITAAERAALFEPFSQQSTRRNADQGLELVLVKRFTEMHGGDVRIEEGAGYGTMVSCWIPDAA